MIPGVSVLRQGTFDITYKFQIVPHRKRESGSSFAIATDYGLDGLESNPGGDEISARPDRPWSPPSLL